MAKEIASQSVRIKRIQKGVAAESKVAERKANRIGAFIKSKSAARAAKENRFTNTRTAEIAARPRTFKKK
ncbi:MAG: hypothetical protein E2O95_04190 [Acidobacteria bacterium]|nr:MAG: hypothetical protein E2O95_04190 [Acidobacteriota bacterium]